MSDFPVGSISSIETVAYGCVSGGLARTLTSPLEVAKISAQVGVVRDTPLQHLSQTYQTDGRRAFFKGNGTACARILPYTAVQYATFQTMKAGLADENGRVTETEAGMAVAISQWTAITLTYPMDVVKTRLTIQPLNQQKVTYRGTTHALRTIGQQEGVRGLFRGLPTTLATTVLSGAAMIQTYKMMNTHMPPKLGQPLTPAENVLRGIAASIVALSVTYPLDTVLRKIQAANRFLTDRSETKKKKPNFFSCLKSTVKDQGVRGLFRGFAPAVVRVAPYHAVTFLTYQACKKTGQMFKPAPKPLTEEEQRQLRRAQMEEYGKMLVEALNEVDEENRLAQEKKG